MSKPEPPHITRARIRFAERCGEQKAFIPVGEEALRIAAEEFNAAPQQNKATTAEREARQARAQLAKAQQDLVAARRQMEDLRAVIHTTRDTREAVKLERKKGRKKLRKLLDVIDKEASAEYNLKKLRKTIEFYLSTDAPAEEPEELAE